MEFMKKFRIGSGLSNFHIYTPLVTDWSRGGTGSEVPESTQAGFCVFFGTRSQKFERNRPGSGVTFQFWQ